MDIRTIDLFDGLTDEDFLAIHKAGQLKKLCLALTLDLNTDEDGKNKTYTA
jgi:hypothetical protein|tara:strand:- start:150 stop:302 length:153 start_codon:yes stop_codon:yes gene_type:complete